MPRLFNEYATALPNHTIASEGRSAEVPEWSADDPTSMLTASASGDLAARAQLVEALYTRLRSVASRQLARDRDNHTLSTTSLVHEAYLKLAASNELTVNDQRHFVALASLAMRRLLIDYSRRYRRRHGTVRLVEPDLLEQVGQGATHPEHLVTLDEALAALEEHDPRLSRLVEMRFFGGLSMRESAEELGYSPRSADRAWVRARAFLYAYLSGAIENDGQTITAEAVA
jgi:RNA polymerase sigma factor (TIGR02999 family)